MRISTGSEVGCINELTLALTQPIQWAQDEFDKLTLLLLHDVQLLIRNSGLKILIHHTSISQMAPLKQFNIKTH